MSLLLETGRAQTFVGTAGEGRTAFSVRVEVGGTAKIDGNQFQTQGHIDLASTLNAGKISFNYLNYISGTGISVSTSIQRLDPITFQLSTYSFTIDVDPYEYYSDALAGVPLIPENDGSLRWDATSTVIRQAISIGGSYTVDGPNQDVSGNFATTVVPIAGFPDLTGYLYVPNYPSYIGLQSFGGLFRVGQQGNPWPLVSGTIDGLPFRLDLVVLEAGAINTNVELTPVPEPRLTAMVSGLGILAFGILRRVRR